MDHSITKDQVKQFCDVHGMVIYVTIEELGIATVEYKRKGVADAVVKQYGRHGVPHIFVSQQISQLLWWQIACFYSLKIYLGVAFGDLPEVECN